jgi:hypothetical protein
MAYHHKTTAEQIRTNLQARIEEMAAELEALKSVTINTKHKTLTNRAVGGGTIINYLNIGKALSVSYAVETATRRQYMNRTITAYSYEDEDGRDLGAVNYRRVSRTITPAELADRVAGIIDNLEDALKQLKREYKRADAIARKQNALIDKIKEFNDSISNAGGAQL